ncbi:MAG: MerR family DNA-binding transcriptional regulator [Solirubrobacteraceae bacterium]
MGIGALAAATGVSERTVRYYEELGIIPTPPRSDGGTRRYPREFQFYIEGALVLKDLGFSLDELKLVGRLAMGSSLTARQRQRALDVIDTKMKALEHRIRLLNRLHELFEHELQEGDSGEDRLVQLLGHASVAPPTAARARAARR